jgi:hypothetical protein
MPAAAATGADADALAKSLASQFRILNVLWIVLTIAQAASFAGVVAAAWNTYVLVKRWKVPRLIERRSPAVIAMYENDGAWFLTFLAVNLLLGGVIGAALIAWEYFGIRAKVLSSRQHFAPAAPRPGY